MTTPAPADELRQAALLLRNLMRRPELAAAVDLPYTEPLADWLEETAEGYDAAVIAARDVWGDEAHEEAREWLATGHGRVSPHALAVARAVTAATHTTA
jgi:hypothetical protein